VSETAAGDVLFIHRACLRLFCRGRRLSRRGRYQTLVAAATGTIVPGAIGTVGETAGEELLNRGHGRQEVQT
jgi:hypothetical protein